MKYTLLITLCTLLIFSCKKDDDKAPDQVTGGQGNPKNISCSESEYIIYDSLGAIEFGYKYYYTGDRLDSAVPINANLYTYVYSYPKDGERRTDYSFNGQLNGGYKIETFNEYGETITEDDYDKNGNTVSSIINEYSCGHASAVSGNKYCLKTKQSYYLASVNETTITDFYYSGTQLDSSITEGTFNSKRVYEYTDKTTRKVITYTDGVKGDNYSIEKINEYGNVIERTSYGKDGIKNRFTEYTLKCD